MSDTIVLLLRARRGRLLGLLAFCLLFLLAAAAARVIAGHEGHIEFDLLLARGGYAFVSALVLLGWLIARLPLIAALVLLAGVISDDRASGLARILHVRPAAPLGDYALRALVLGTLAFLISAIVLPAFDLLVLGRWVGWSVFPLIATHVLVYGSLVVLFSVWTRADAWIALFIALLAMVWHALREVGALEGVVPWLRELISFVLPPQGALQMIELAFAQQQPVPWTAVAFVVGYSGMLLLVAGLVFDRREL